MQEGYGAVVYLKVLGVREMLFLVTPTVGSMDCKTKLATKRLTVRSSLTRNVEDGKGIYLVS